MRDVEKLCQCGKKHKWGIVGHSQDNVKLYGAHPEEGCPEFREDTEEARALTTMTPKEVTELWSATNFLNPQVPVATRKMVNAIIEAGKGKKGMLARIFGGGDKSVMERQWPEFMGLMISQLTDVRGAMVREDSKFAHLIAHSDEIVESMKDVVQLKEQLATHNRLLERILEKLEAKDERTFAEVSAPLWNEPILTDAEENYPPVDTNMFAQHKVKHPAQYVTDADVADADDD